VASTPGRWTGPAAAAIVLLAGAAPFVLNRPPPARPGGGPGFSVERAWSHIDAVARAPHPVGTPEHDRVRSYLLGELAELGLVVDTQTVQMDRPTGSTSRSTPVRNVMGRLPGRGPGSAVLLMSHYDAVPSSFGAGDDGVGVATVLETARQLAAGETLSRDVIFLITDAEELGLLGAQAFAEAHPWMADVGVVLNFEARGMSGPALMFETGPRSGELVRAFGRVGRRPVTSSLLPEAYRRLPNDTDFTIFARRGLPGLNFALAGAAHWYHTPGDRPENLSRASLQHMGDNALALARHLAGLPAAVERSEVPVYFSVPGLGLVHYPAGLAVPLAVLLVGAYLAVGVYVGRRGRLGWWGIPAGLLAGVLSVIVAAVAAMGVWVLVRELHPEYGSVIGRALYREWPYLAAFVGLPFAAVLAAFGVLRRWLGPEELALGALLGPVLLAAATAFQPAVSYVYLWPTALALGALALRARAPVAADGVETGAPGGDAGVPVRGAGSPPPGSGARSQLRAHILQVGAVALTALAVLLLATLVQFLAIFLGAGAAPLIATAAGLVVLLMVPVIDLLGHPNRIWLPAAAALVVVGLVAYGSLTAGA
jgi:hypothetical protein